jgi:hypothetical protein
MTAPITLKTHNALRDYIRDYQKQFPAEIALRAQRDDLALFCGKSELYAMDEKVKRAIDRIELSPEHIVEAPLAVSQLESMTAMLVEVFLSGYPIFGVVSNSKQIAAAEQIETLIAHYSLQGGWHTALERILHSAVKHRVTAFALDTQYRYSLPMYTKGASQEPKAQLCPKIVAPDLYNVFVDVTQSPVNMQTQGTIFGYSEIMSRIGVKEMLLAIARAGIPDAEGLANTDKWEDTDFPYARYKLSPVHFNLQTSSGVDQWSTFWGASASLESTIGFMRAYYPEKPYLVTTVYLKCLPEDFHLKVPNARHPQILRLVLINFEYIVHYNIISTPNNMLPAGMVDLNNDGMAYVGASGVEKLHAMQYASSAILNAMVMGADRAVGDRAIYDPMYLDPGNLEKTKGAGFIPVTKSLAVQGVNMQNIYEAIPFDGSLLVHLPGLLSQLLTMSQYTMGINDFTQGIPRKGNRTLGEFSEVQGNSNMRIQVPAMLLEHQLFVPLRLLVKTWITQKATPTTVINHRLRRQVEITSEILSSLDYEFSLSTGFFDKSKLAGTPVLAEAFQVLQQNPQLAQRYNVADLFAHLMSLMGVQDLAQYIYTPEELQQQQQQQQQQSQQPPQ